MKIKEINRYNDKLKKSRKYNIKISIILSLLFGMVSLIVYFIILYTISIWYVLYIYNGEITANQVYKVIF